jgi:hypothetical protein
MLAMLVSSLSISISSIIDGGVTINTKKNSINNDGVFCDPAGARTRDPLLKRQMLYQLSYKIVFRTAKIESLF